MEPSRLVLRALVCDYCKACKNGDINIYDVELGHVFGIRCCTTCMPFALSDTKAYLQKWQFLPIELIKNHVFFMKLGSTFSVLRSDGTVEHDWELNQSRLERQFVRKYIDGDYVIPIINSSASLNKHMKIKQFLQTNYKHLQNEYDELIPYIEYLMENMTLEQVRMCVRIIQFT